MPIGSYNLGGVMYIESVLTDCNNQNILFQSIADALEVNICFAEDGICTTFRDLSIEDLINRSCYNECDYSIIIGVYKNTEYRLVSFFHELGHHMNGTDLIISHYIEEYKAWESGFEAMKIIGLNPKVLSKQTQKWIRKQHMTYFWVEWRDGYSFIDKVLFLLKNLIWFFKHY